MIAARLRAAHTFVRALPSLLGGAADLALAMERVERKHADLEGRIGEAVDEVADLRRRVAELDAMMRELYTGPREATR